MDKTHPLEFRERFVAHVEAGNTHRSAAAQFDVSIKFVNDTVNLNAMTGALTPKPQSNGGWAQAGF